MEVKLDPLQEGVIAVNSNSISLNNSTQEVIFSLDELNTTSLNASVYEIKQTLQQMKIDLNQTAADINESRLEIRALDAVLIYQQGFDVLAGHLMPLVGYGIAGLGLAYVLLRREVMG